MVVKNAPAPGRSQNFYITLWGGYIKKKINPGGAGERSTPGRTMKNHNINIIFPGNFSVKRSKGLLDRTGENFKSPGDLLSKGRIFLPGGVRRLEYSFCG